MNKQAAKTTPVDVQGRAYKVGDKVARAAKFYQMDGLHIQVVTVTEVRDGKVFLDGSKRHVNFPDRMAILG